MGGVKDELLNLAMTASNGLLTILALVIIIDPGRAREIVPIGLVVRAGILVYEWRERRNERAAEGRAGDQDEG